MLDIIVVLIFIVGCFGYVPKDNLPACIRDSKNGVCGRKGDATAPNLYQYEVFNDPALTKVPNLDACRIACMQFQYDEGYQRTCRSLAWNSSNKTCILYSERPATVGFKARASSPFEFYNYACFDCLSGCPMAGGNILTNPDFDRPTAAARSLENTNATVKPWNDDLQQGYSTQNLLLTSNGFGSPNSLRITPFGTLKQTFHACVGQTYEISFDYKMESISSQDARWWLEVGNSGYGGPYRTQIPLYVTDKDRWFHFLDTFQATNLSMRDYGLNSKPNPLTSFIQFDYQGDSYNAFFVDNMVVRPVSLASYTAAPNSKNLLVNGGFESGRLGVWRNPNAPQTPMVLRTPGFNSKYAVAQVVKPGSSGSGGQIAQNFSPQTGKQYLFSFRYKRSANCAANSKIMFVFRNERAAKWNGEESFGATTHEVFFEGAPNQWILHQRPFTATGTEMSITLVHNGGTCDPMIDDISLRPIA